MAIINSTTGKRRPIGRTARKYQGVKRWTDLSNARTLRSAADVLDKLDPPDARTRDTASYLRNIADELSAPDAE